MTVPEDRHNFGGAGNGSVMIFFKNSAAFAGFEKFCLGALACLRKRTSCSVLRIVHGISMRETSIADLLES